MIGIIDYGLGNVMAFYNLFNSVDIPSRIITNPNQIDQKIIKLILPGVGSFDNSIKLLDSKGFIEKIIKYIDDYSMPILGVCVGMQIFANGSEEGTMKGLGMIPGKVKKFNFDKTTSMTVPHMGWNSVFSNDTDNILKNINIGKFYFLHSYYYKCEDEKHVNGTSNYGFNFTSVISKDNIYGVQFHPEKSHKDGIQLLINFSKL